MKKSKNLFKRIFAGGVSAVLSAGLLATPVFAADNLINTPYEYPVVPGTEEWAELMSFPEKIEVCKIPEGKAEAMSTEALIETILNHPIWTIYFAYDMDSVYDIYSEDIIVALKELEQREDADELLLARYQADQVAPMSLDNATDEDGSKSEFLEILLAQPVFYDDLNETELEALDKEAAEKAEIRRTDGKAYVNRSPFYSVLAAKQNVQTTSIQKAPPYTYTPNGSRVVLEKNDPTVDDAAQANAHFAKMFIKANRLDDPTGVYNCHSYAWYNPSSSNSYWLRDPSIYWTDGSYTAYTPGSSIAANTRVLFKQNKNAGVDNWHSVYVRTSQATRNNYAFVVAESKWGMYGLYEHYLLDHPYATDKGGNFVPNYKNYTMTFYHR